jgi:hypothetical protein
MSVRAVVAGRGETEPLRTLKASEEQGGRGTR